MKMTTAAISTLVLLVAGVATAQNMKITSVDSRPSSVGPEENFTGTAVVDPLFAPTKHTRASGALVTFEPGARSAWHTHPAGQTIIVEEGVGWVQEWGGKKREIKHGDLIWTPPGVKHWHGATPTHRMTHLVVQEAVDGKVVDWKEKVSDEQYKSSKNEGETNKGKD